MKNIKHRCGYCKSDNIVKLYNEKDKMFLLALTIACENCGAVWEIREYGEVALSCGPQVPEDKEQ